MMIARVLFCSLLVCGLAVTHAQIPVTIVNVVIDSSDHTTLEALVVRADLATTLQGTGNFTLFAPTDTAFTNLGSSTLVNKITANPLDAKWKPLLQDVLKYHVVNGFVKAGDLPATATATATLSPGSTLALKNTAPQIVNRSATVSTADVVTGNGVVHVIDSVLLPLSTGRNVVDIAVSTGVHTTLANLLTSAGLVATLETDSTATAFTVFAPTDAAFAKLDAATLACLQRSENSALLSDLLRFHVVDGTVTSGMLTDGMDIATIADGDKKFQFVSGTELMASSSSMITSADVLGSNGVVHVIDTVLIPDYFTCPATIVTTVINSPDHTMLETLLAASSLIPALQGPGNFTLFAPVDRAVNLLPAAMRTKLASGGQWQPLLDEILQYHVLVGAAPVMAADLPATATSFDTLATGAPLSIKSSAPQLTATGTGGTATVNATDLTTSNGVVHTIESVLLPPVATRTVVDVVTGSADHTTLASLLTDAELVATLSATTATSAFTVFADQRGVCGGRGRDDDVSGQDREQGAARRPPQVPRRRDRDHAGGPGRRVGRRDARGL